ncbi:MAG: hypothetical protein HY753_04830 [Nitrospirae bacterium]|nr:hypothetical protein [Nitrospirota bacterium]
MNGDRLAELISEVRNPEPARTTIDIYKFIEEHRIVAQHQFGNFIKNFEDFFDDLNTAIWLLNYVPKNTWPKHRGIQYFLYPETLKTLHCSFEIAINGNYDESVMLARSVFETYLRIVFISCFPSDWESVFNDLRGRRRFDVTSLIRDHLKVDWYFIYRIMCKVHHSKSHLHLKKIIERSMGVKHPPVQLEYKGDKKALGMAVNLIILDLTLLFHMMMTLFAPDFDNHSELKKRKARLKKIDTVLLGLIQSNDRPQFSAISNDMLKIEKLVHAADAGRDWTKLV